MWWRQRFEYWRQILRTIWSYANAYSNTNCNRNSDCNSHADSDPYTDAVHGEMYANATAAPYSGASADALSSKWSVISNQ